MSSFIEKPVIFQNHFKQNLWGIIVSPKTKKKHPAVIMVHGFSGTKTQRKFVDLSRKLTDKGYLAMRFDFSGCGDSEGELQKFSITKQVKELKAAVDYLKKQKNVDQNRIAILGYSLGALVSMLYQIKEKTAKCFIMLAPALNQESLFKDWFKPSDIKKWKRLGYLDGSKGRVGINYLQESKNYSSLAKGLNIPTLIIHGLEDKDVLPKYSKQLFRFLSQQKKISFVKNTDHGFEGYQSKKELAVLMLNWLNKYL